MNELKKICVFCGSSPGGRASYTLAAGALGRALSSRGLGLVYGGGAVGMMGALARAVLAGGGAVTGVIPQDLFNRKLGFESVTELRVVQTMHERKALMAELSDGFIAMPGGFGTLEEIFEVVTWAQLGIHKKPCGLLNIDGFYDPVVTLLDHLAAELFIDPGHRALIMVEQDPERLLERFAAFVPPVIDKAAWALKLQQAGKTGGVEIATVAGEAELNSSPRQSAAAGEKLDEGRLL